MLKQHWNNPSTADEVLATGRGSVFTDRVKLRSQDLATSNLLAYITALEECIYNTYSITNDFGIRKKGHLSDWERAFHESTIDGRDRNGNYV
jgi:hypothetical protein